MRIVNLEEELPSPTSTQFDELMYRRLSSLRYVVDLVRPQTRQSTVHLQRDDESKLHLMKRGRSNFVSVVNFVPDWNTPVNTRDNR